MGIDPGQLREHVIRPALEGLGLYSLAAEELLLGTACQESHCGQYLQQLGNGPALGIFQMEPATHDDLHANFIAHRPQLRIKVNNLSLRIGIAEMVWNLAYAAAMCRVHYLRVSEPLPSAGNLNAQAHYWKSHWNTPLGAGTVQEYVANWNRYAGS
jgi:hypothetical protein